MDLFNLTKDVVLLPLDLALDLAGITPTIRAFSDDDDDESLFGTIDRFSSICDDIED